MTAPISSGPLLGQRIRELRKERGWSARVLAERACEVEPDVTSRASIASLEVGRRSDVSIREAAAFAAAFDLSLFALLAPDGDPDPSASFRRGREYGRAEAMSAIARLPRSTIPPQTKEPA